MMLARTVKLNCDTLHDVTKQLLVWVLKEKRKFSTSKGKQHFRDDYYEENYRRRDNYYGDGDRFNRRGPLNRQFRGDFKSKSRRSFDKLMDSSSPLDWNSIQLKPFVNDFYKPHPNVLSRSPEEIKNFHEKHNLQIFGHDCPAPIFNFEELGLPEDVSNYLSQFNFTEPTPIQSQTWPIALSGRDLVGISRTGSGKTLGYVLPAIVHIQNQPSVESSEGPIALVLAPTRELVQQIRDVVNPIARASGMHAASLFGGASKIVQMNDIRNRKEIYVATPGRLLDFLNDEVTNLKRCTYLVLDEADEMLNMGFEPQIRNIINKIRPDRQVLMWSATWPRDIKNLASDYLNNYIKIQVGSEELTANPNIIQVIHVCQKEEKMDLLTEILNKIKREPENKTLIFVQTKYDVERIGRALHSRGIPAKTLHGDQSQRVRNLVMSHFRSGRSNILVATNVAGRGLDVSDIRYVINYDFPQTVEEYVHKIGRTARSNNEGTAHTFFTHENASLAKELISVLENTNQIVSPELKEMADARHYKFQSRRLRSYKY